MEQVYRNVKVVPLLVGSLIIVPVFGAYTVAYWYGHIDFEITIISDALNFPPESTVFGFGLVVGSGLMVVKVYIRYFQLLCTPAPLRPPLELIETGFWAGIGCAFGTSIVGGFQMSTMHTTHWLGATVAFATGCAYSYIQAVCTTYARPKDTMLIRFRFAIALIQIVTFALTMIGVNTAFFIRGEIRTPKNRHIGHEWMLLGAVSEWILVSCEAFIVFSFYRDFSQIVIVPPKAMETRRLAARRKHS